MALLLVVQWLERDLAGKPGPTFPDRAQNLKFEGAQAPKKEARPKDRAHLTRCGAIYSEIAEKQWFNSTIAERFVGVKLSQIGGFCRILQRLNELAMAGVSWRRKIGPPWTRSGAFMHG
jgi:hypothetical protein